MPRHKRAARAREKENGLGALPRGAVALDVLVAQQLARVRILLGEDEVGVGGTQRGDVDGDAARRKVLGPAPAHRVERRLGAAVEVGRRDGDPRGDAADVDDAPARRREVPLGRLEQQEDAARVDVEGVGKVLGREARQVGARRDGAGVVDDDVDGPAGKGRERRVDNVPAVRDAARVGLDRDGRDAERLDGLYVFEGAVLAAVVVDDDLAARKCLSCWAIRLVLTSAPCSARSRAVAKPTPLGLPAPVTMASCPWRFLAGMFKLFGACPVGVVKRSVRFVKHALDETG